MGVRQTTFLDYDDFVDKFKPKLTTDDCYTPPAVYEAVLAWVRKRYGLADDVPILRPFKPGGDYEAEEYPQGAVVVDNPPFSICARIVRFYQANKVPFFLFTNGLTMFGLARHAGVGFVVVKENIVFENGAVVSCGFCTNLPGANLVELAEAQFAYAQGDKAACIEELYDAVAVLMRMIAVVEGKQRLGGEA